MSIVFFKNGQWHLIEDKQKSKIGLLIMLPFWTKLIRQSNCNFKLPPRVETTANWFCLVMSYPTLTTHPFHPPEIKNFPRRKLHFACRYSLQFHSNKILNCVGKKLWNLSLPSPVDFLNLARKSSSKLLCKKLQILAFKNLDCIPYRLFNFQLQDLISI